MAENLNAVDKLRGSENFSIWFSTIYNIPRSKKLQKYVDEQYLSILPVATPDNPLTEVQTRLIASCNAEDAQASTIITTTVIDRIKFLIKDCHSAFDKINKLKELYQVNQSILTGIWLKRLYSIKARNLYDTMETINEVIELLKKLENSDMNPSNIEKLTIMYESLPKELQSKINFSSNFTVDEFYNEIKDKNTILLYRKDRGLSHLINFSKTRNPLSNPNPKNNSSYDPMDLDNFETYPNQINYITNNKNQLFCFFCNNKGHLAKDCYFNPCGTNRNNPRVIQKFTKNNNNKHKNNNNKKTINTIQTDIVTTKNNKKETRNPSIISKTRIQINTPHATKKLNLPMVIPVIV